MYCSQCGTQLTEGAAFCENCAPRMRSTPLMPTAGRIAGHVRLLGIFWLALSGLRLLPGLALLLIFGGGWTFLPNDIPAFVPVLLMTLGGLISFGAIAGIVTGWGLLNRESWARILAIVMGCLNLMDLPFGTALGAYTLWVLLPAGSEEEYRRLGASESHLAGQASG